MSTPSPPGGLLEGWQYLNDFARDEVKKHPRTVSRWCKKPDGLPYSTLGNSKIIHIETARQWLFSRMRQRNPRRSKRA